MNIEQLEGFIFLDQDMKVCRFVKLLHELKQVLKQWHKKFNKVMLSKWIQINECGICIYIKKYTWDVIGCMSIENMLIMNCDRGYNHDEKEIVDKILWYEGYKFDICNIKH